MALPLRAGVFQMIRSTPGVCLPWFSVTRRTANALSLNERVSRRCKAFTLPHRPAFVACTIRAWSRRTFVWTTRQSMACQSTVAWEAAPAELCAAVICFASWIGSPCVRVRINPREVGALSRRGMSPPVSAPLPGSVRFLPHPLPAPPSWALQPFYPGRGAIRAYRVPRERQRRG